MDMTLPSTGLTNVSNNWPEIDIGWFRNNETIRI